MQESLSSTLCNLTFYCYPLFTPTALSTVLDAPLCHITPTSTPLAHFISFLGFVLFCHRLCTFTYNTFYAHTPPCNMHSISHLHTQFHAPTPMDHILSDLPVVWSGYFSSVTDLSNIHILHYAMIYLHLSVICSMTFCTCEHWVYWRPRMRNPKRP